MSDLPSNETREKISVLCKKISVAHNLDEEIRKELFTHMEDKLLAYLKGDEKLTEDDAFILMSEHFGDPVVIKDLYQEVEAVATRMSLARKIGAVLIATTGYGITTRILLNIAIYSNLVNIRIVFMSEPFHLFFILLFKFILSTTLLSGILVIWWRKMKKGHILWFQNINPLAFFTISVTFLVIYKFHPLQIFADRAFTQMYNSNPFLIHMLVLYYSYIAINIVICLLWCNIPHLLIILIKNISHKLKAVFVT